MIQLKIYYLLNYGDNYKEKTMAKKGFMVGMLCSAAVLGLVLTGCHLFGKEEKCARNGHCSTNVGNGGYATTDSCSASKCAAVQAYNDKKQGITRCTCE
jgi:hypothetical protein